MDASLQETARKAKRVEVSIHASLLRANGLVQQVELLDVSFFGCKASAESVPERGEYVKLELPNIGFVRARVSWVGGGFFGVAFPNAVDVRKCVAATPASGRVAPSPRS